jgi:hypothetical protein
MPSKKLIKKNYFPSKADPLDAVVNASEVGSMYPFAEKKSLTNHPWFFFYL